VALAGSSACNDEEPFISKHYRCYTDDWWKVGMHIIHRFMKFTLQQNFKLVMHTLHKGVLSLKLYGI